MGTNNEFVQSNECEAMDRKPVISPGPPEGGLWRMGKTSAPPAGIGPATFGLGNSRGSNDHEGLGIDPGLSRAYDLRGELVAALQAVALGAPDSVTRCVEAIGRCLEHLETCEPLHVSRPA